jgi:hypothetical protein
MKYFHFLYTYGFFLLFVGQTEALPIFAIMGKGVELIPTTAKETWASLFFLCVRFWTGKLEN